MTRVENFSRFQIFVESLMFHVWKKSPLLCHVVRWGKMFSIMHSCVMRMSNIASRSQNHVSLWHWELREMSNWRCRRSLEGILPWFSLARIWCDLFLATPQSKARRHYLPLISSRNSQCLIENVFPHVLSREFWSAWNNKSSRKNWNQLKFSTRVISRVYCSM